VWHNLPCGIFPDKIALESLKASGAGPAEPLKLIDMIVPYGRSVFLPGFAD
jgi:hypothetical protein